MVSEVKIIKQKLEFEECLKQRLEIIKNNTFLVFNYSNDEYISNLTKRIKISKLEEYLNKNQLK